MTNEAISQNERLAIEGLCASLIGRFALLVDHRRYDELVALFTPDGVFERPNAKAEGTDGILAFMRARPEGIKSRHVCAMPVFETVGRDDAYAVTYVTMFHGEGADGEAVKISGIAGVVDFVDRFRRDADGWRIVHHESRIAMIASH